MNACEVNAAYQRHLLALMEIQPWVSKNTPTTAAALWGCRMQQSSVVSTTKTSDLAQSADAIARSMVTSTDSQAQANTDSQVQVDTAPMPATFAQHAPVQQAPIEKALPTASPIASPVSSVPLGLERANDGADGLAEASTEIRPPTSAKSLTIAMTTALSEYLGDVAVSAPRLYLHGLRYRHWLLLVDAEEMDTAALGVWQSLEKALDNERHKRMATGEAVAFMARTLRYPLSDDIAQDGQDYQRLMSLLGFLSRLCQVGDVPPSHVGCLTALAGIDLGRYLSGCMQSVPSLQVMAYQNAQKIALWRQLQGD